MSHRQPLSVLTYDFPGGILAVNPQILHVVGETLVQPEVIPPVHRHYVAEPLVVWIGMREKRMRQL